MTAPQPRPLLGVALPRRAPRPWPKAASLALLATLLVGGGLLIAADLGAIDQARQAIAARETLLDSLRRAAQREKPDDARANPTSSASPYLAGESETIAAAGLQTLVVDTVEARSGRVASALVRLPQVGTSDGSLAGTARPVDAEVAFEAGVAGLQDVLFDLETGRPAITVSRLQIQPQRADRSPAGAPDEGEPTLRVVLAVRAFWKR